MTTVTLHLPDDLLPGLVRAPADLAGHVRLLLAIDGFVCGLISQGRAAEIAEVPRADFFHELAKRRIENVAVDLDEIDREIRS